jgi:serine/threonine-protein kinase
MFLFSVLPQGWIVPSAAPAPELEIEVEVEVAARSRERRTALAAPTTGRSYRHGLEVGSGGMAAVHIAFPEDSLGADGAVALKRIHPHLASRREYLEMFLDEARLASRIRHPNVCEVLDFGADAGSFYLAMPYLRGRSLRTAMRAVPERERVAWPILAARVVADAAAGLHAAHELVDERGASLAVVHRDVSPHNLFVTWDGTVKVVDFGIAHARGRMHHTETGIVKGRFAYMAPEQMRGGAVDRRADVWSLGVVLFELLTGSPLFERESQSETVIAVSKGERPRLSERVPQTPHALEAIVDRALAVDPSARFASAEELRMALLCFLDDQAGPTDAREVAAWMQRFFPHGRERDAALVERAFDASLPVLGGAGAAPASVERSGVVRRSQPPGRTPPAWIALFVLALALSVALGALAARWP